MMTKIHLDRNDLLKLMKDKKITMENPSSIDPWSHDLVLCESADEVESRHKRELIEMFHTYVSGDFAAVIKEAFEQDWKEKPYPLFDFDELVSAMGGECSE